MNIQTVTTCILFCGTALSVFAPVAYALDVSCGNGNNRYSMSSNQQEVFYAASKDEFNVTKISTNEIQIEDTVPCRYGTDTLIDIETVIFLDGELSTEELVTNQAVRVLSLDVLRNFVKERLTEQYSFFGYDKKANTTTPASNGGFSTTSGGNDPYGVFTSSALGNSNTSLKNLGVTGYTYDPSNVRPTYYNSGVTNTSVLYDATSQGITGNTTTQFSSSAQAVVVPVIWDATKVGYYDIVYFEAVYGSSDTKETRFLGSSSGFRGGAEVSVPSSLLGESSLTINIRSGSTHLGSVPIQTGS